MIPILDFQERSLRGPVMKAMEFDVAFSKKLRELVAHYEISRDPEAVGVDDRMADAIFEAGVQLHAEVGLYHLDTQRVMLTCKLPLNEILIDFHDKLKSVSRGYASMDYEHAGYQADDLVKLDIMVHGEVGDAFSSIVHRSKAGARGLG